MNRSETVLIANIGISSFLFALYDRLAPKRQEFLVVEDVNYYVLLLFFTFDV